MTPRSIFALAACAALTATSALAQQPQERQLREGRILSAPAQVEGCEAPMVTENSPASLGLDFICQMTVQGAAEPAMIGVGVVLLTLPVLVKPMDFLVAQTESWWPDTTPEDRTARILTQTKLIDGAPMEFLCAHRSVEDAPATIVCVMEADALQFMVSGRSATLAGAEQGMDTVLAGFGLRPGEPAPDAPAT